MGRVKNYCSIEGCKNEYRAKGFCNKHYQRVIKHGDPLTKLTKVAKGTWNKQSCSAKECNRPVKAKGICSMHYARDMRLKHTGLPTRKRRDSNEIFERYT